MKRLLLFTLLCPFLFSCKQSASPKETAQEYVKAVYTADLQTAKALSSSDTKTIVDKAKSGTKATGSPADLFAFQALNETVRDKNADVKNDVVSLSIVKEEEGWKIVTNEALLNDIQEREERLAAVKTKWESLLKEYEGRLQVLRDYVNYKKSLGALSPNVQKLADMVNSFSPQKEWTRETMMAYVQKQEALNKILDNALEPSLAANTDLSLNYFLQISNAGDRIKKAEKEYQPAAEKARSPVYAPLPLKSANSLQARNN